MASPFRNSVPVTSFNPIATGGGQFLAYGKKWGGALGTGVNLTYSFANANSAHTNPYGGYYNAGEWLGASALTAGEQTAVRTALGAWSAVANITFTEVTETSSNVGELRFAKTSYDTEYEYAHAYLPTSNPAGGDVWFSTSNWNTARSATIRPGSDDFHTIVHELGHALGLKHSFEAPNAIPAALDNYFYTVMSYSARTVGDSGTASFLPTTPQYYDLVAIQSIYGRNLSHNAGNTTYTFVEGQRYFQTIDDASGIDTIQYSGTTGVTINLSQGGFSSVSAPIIFDRGVTSRATVTIGPNTIIENATGGSGSDALIGNSSGNVLIGGAGNDGLYGYEGNDTLYGGAGNDAFFFVTGPGAASGVDRLADFNYVADQIYLSSSVFTKIVKGTLTASQFWTGAAAHDSNDYIVYDKARGTLYYDADGTGAAAKIAFATVAAGTALFNTDIVIY